MGKLGALPQEGGERLKQTNPYLRIQGVHGCGTKSNLMEYSWLMAERRSLSWENESKSEKYENRKVDDLMWKTFHTTQSLYVQQPA